MAKNRPPTFVGFSVGAGETFGKWMKRFPMGIVYIYIHHANPQVSCFKAYNPYFKGLKFSCFMVVGSKGIHIHHIRRFLAEK